MTIKNKRVLSDSEKFNSMATALLVSMIQFSEQTCPKTFKEINGERKKVIDCDSCPLGKLKNIELNDGYKAVRLDACEIITEIVDRKEVLDK